MEFLEKMDQRVKKFGIVDIVHEIRRYGHKSIF